MKLRWRLWRLVSTTPLAWLRLGGERQRVRALVVACLRMMERAASFTDCAMQAVDALCGQQENRSFSWLFLAGAVW